MRCRSIYQLLFFQCVFSIRATGVWVNVCVCVSAWRVRAYEAARSGRLKDALELFIGCEPPLIKWSRKEGYLTQRPTHRSAMQHGEGRREGGEERRERRGRRRVRVWLGEWGWCDERRREEWGVGEKKGLRMRMRKRGCGWMEEGGRNRGEKRGFQGQTPPCFGEFTPLFLLDHEKYA